MLTLAVLCIAANAHVSVAWTAGSHFARDAGDIQQYLLQVNSARYAVSTIQVGTESAVCGQTSLPQDFAGSNIDPSLSRQLICEAAVGIVVFPDLTAASTALADAYAGLQSLASGVGSPSSQCLGFDPSSLNEAGINGTAVQQLICASASTSASASSVIGAIASVSGLSAFPLGNGTQSITSSAPVSSDMTAGSAPISQPIAITATFSSLPASSGRVNSGNGTIVIVSESGKISTTTLKTAQIATLSGTVGPSASDIDTFSIQTSPNPPVVSPPLPSGTLTDSNGSQPTATLSDTAVSNVTVTPSASGPPPGTRSGWD